MRSDLRGRPRPRKWARRRVRGLILARVNVRPQLVPGNSSGRLDGKNVFGRKRLPGANPFVHRWLCHAAKLCQCRLGAHRGDGVHKGLFG